MYVSLSSMAWAAVAAFFIWKLDRFAHAWLTTGNPTSATPAIVIPPDLLAVAMGESEQWAQDEALKTIRERYEAYGDWNKVRSAIGIGAL